MFIFFSEKLNIAQPFLNQCQDLNVSLTFKAQRLSEGVARALGAPAASAERWSSVPSTCQVAHHCPQLQFWGSDRCLCPPHSASVLHRHPLTHVHAHSETYTAMHCKNNKTNSLQTSSSPH